MMFGKITIAPVANACLNLCGCFTMLHALVSPNLPIILSSYKAATLHPGVTINALAETSWPIKGHLKEGQHVEHFWLNPQKAYRNL
jgi:hypothetical protein